MVEIDDVVIAIQENGPIRHSELYVVSEITENGVWVEGLNGHRMFVFREIIDSHFKVIPDAYCVFLEFSVAVIKFHAELKKLKRQIIGETIDDGSPKIDDGGGADGGGADGGGADGG